MIGLHFASFYNNKLTLIFCISFCWILNFHQVFSQEKAPVKTASDTAATIPDTLLFRIERAQNVITQINAHNKTGYNLAAIRMQLPEIKANISEIKEDVSGTSRIIEIKTLLSYQSILRGEQTQLAEWRKTLSGYNNELRQMSDQIISFSGDTLLSPAEKDTTGKQLYSKQLSDLKQNLQASGKTTTTTLDSVGAVLAEVSTVFFEINDLQTAINEHLKTSGQNALSKESPYLWSAPAVTTTTNLGQLFRTSYQGQNRILSYFISSTWDNRLLLIVFGVAFFIWVFRNFKVVNKVPANPKLTVLKFTYISRMPLLATLIVVLNLTPFFEPASPPFYIELIQLALLFALTLFFRTK
ncbi:MAG: mechanosensitive ion channel protein, partial [Sphingobacteriaceae bacterium]